MNKEKIMKKRVTYRNLTDLAKSYGLSFCQSAPMTGAGRTYYNYFVEMDHKLNKWIKKNYKVKVDKSKHSIWNYILDYNVVDVNFDGREKYQPNEDRCLRYTNRSQKYKDRYPNLKAMNDIDLSNEYISRITDLSWQEWNDRFAALTFMNSTDNPEDPENPIVKAIDFYKYNEGEK